MTSASTPGLAKLTMFLADLDGGGAERMMVVIANGLAARGVEVELVVASATGPYVKELDAAVELVDLGTGSVTNALLPLIRHLRNEPTEVLLTTLAHSSLVAIIASKLSFTRLPVVVREANTPTRGGMAWTSRKSNAAHLLMRWAYRAATGVMSVSDGVTAALRAVIGVPAEKIATLYNPVVSSDLRRLAQSTPDHPWFGPGQPPVILGVGSLTPRKDFRTLIEAFALLSPAADLRLVILGEGPERHALQQLVDELGLTTRVDMAGFKQNPFAYMANAAVYVLSSHLEGLPGSLIQALACGTPAVATDCPSGPYEILQGGKIGPLVAVGDAQALAEAIARTLASPLSDTTLMESVEKYSAEKVLDATHAYLSQIAHGQVLDLKHGLHGSVE